MDKKITRRLAIGTLVAGLASGPFIIRSLRQPINLHEQSEEIVGRTMILAKIAENSRLPVSDVERVLAIYQAERERWLKFRGLKAKVNITCEGYSPATNGKILSFTEQGIISLQITEESVEGDSLPWKYHLRFEPDGKESGEYTMFSDSSKKPPVLKGRRTEVADPQVLLDVITSPFAFFACPWTRTETVMAMLGLDSWRLRKEVSVGEIAEGFCFQIVDRHKIDHISLPEVSFIEGYFSSIKGKTSDGCNYCNVHSRMVEISNHHFPSILMLETDDVAEQAKVKHSIVLSDVELATV
jgi:hypothetical protein